MAPIHDEIHRLQLKMTELSVHDWRQHFFLTPLWWVKLATLILPWVLWWRLVDRKKISLVAVYALLTGLINILLDIVGVHLGLWSYPKKLFPVWDGMISGELSITAVMMSLIYQYFPPWREYIAASIAGLAFLAFIGEPLLRWAKLYELHHWNFGYSFIIYLAVAVIVKWSVDKIGQAEA